MVDDPKKPEDEFAEENFDFDDLDEISDEELDAMEAEFEDEDFEDFDDADFEAFDDDEGAGIHAASANQQNDKTFLQKYFNIIVIFVVAAFGLLAFLGLSGGNNQQITQQQAPVDATTQEVFATEEVIATQDVTESQEETEEIFAVDQMPEPAPTPQEQIAEAPLDMDKPENALTPMPMDLFQEAAPLEEIVETAALETEDIAGSAATPEAAQDAQPIQTLIPDNSSEELQKLQIENEKLKKDNKELEAKLASSQFVIQSNNDTRQRLRSENRDLKEQLSVLEERLARAKSQAPSQSKSTSQTKSQTASRATKTRSSNAQPKTYSWTLRSASDGRAMISQKGSNDLRSIQVGENVPGLGVIRSISLENGLWVVKGSQNNVTQ